MLRVVRLVGLRGPTSSSRAALYLRAARRGRRPGPLPSSDLPLLPHAHAALVGRPGERGLGSERQETPSPPCVRAGDGKRFQAVSFSREGVGRRRRRCDRRRRGRVCRLVLNKARTGLVALDRPSPHSLPPRALSRDPLSITGVHNRFYYCTFVIRLLESPWRENPIPSPPVAKIVQRSRSGGRGDGRETGRPSE